MNKTTLLALCVLGLISGCKKSMPTKEIEPTPAEIFKQWEKNPVYWPDTFYYKGGTYFFIVSS
jgi:hypothetical protein